jgi:6-phospho-3-hexuloisomerase
VDSLSFCENLIQELRETLLSVSPAEVEEISKAIVTAERIFLAGAGQSGIIMHIMAMLLMQIGFKAHIAGDATTPAIRSGDLLIAASYSGRTSMTKLYTEKARKTGARVALLTANPASDIASDSDHIVIISTAYERGCLNGSVYYKGDDFVHALHLLIHWIIRRVNEQTGICETDMLSKHANLE